jgi:hypothetical protein
MIKKQSRFLPALAILLAIGRVASAESVEAPRYALSLYGGQMTANSIDDFFDSVGRMKYEDSYLFGVALARKIVQYGDFASLEVEGQIARHFDIQEHWELNALVAARWEKFYWDEYVDTSFAVGVGPSYATRRPVTEEQGREQTSHLLTYVMIELELALPSHPNTALITRIHHRSGAFGVVAEDGSSNALVFGIKHRF